MIQLHESDLLWKYYDRYYQGVHAMYRADGRPPHPHSVCNFFWLAIGGMLKALFWDTPVWLAGPLCIIICTLVIWLFNQVPSSNPSLGVFLLMSCMVSVLFSFAFFASRWGYYWSNQGNLGELVNAISILVLIYLFVSVSLSFAWTDQTNDWQFIFLFYGMLATIAVIAAIATMVGIVILLFTPKTSTGRVIRAYLGSFKSWVCPLVKAPWEKNES